MKISTIVQMVAIYFLLAGAALSQDKPVQPNSVPRPPKELKGFVKVNLKPGETRHVTVPLDTRSLAYFDVDNGVWKAPMGTYRILVGTSSAQIDLSSDINLPRTLTEKP
jgi:beta-glucosidase